MARITIVNDSPEFLDLVRDILEGDRYETTLIDGDDPDAVNLIRSSRPDLLMIDVRLGVAGDRGWQIAQEVRSEAEFAELPVLLCSADMVDLAGDLRPHLISQTSEHRQPASGALGGHVRPSDLVAAVDGRPRADGDRPDRESHVGSVPHAVVTCSRRARRSVSRLEASRGQRDSC